MLESWSYSWRSRVIFFISRYFQRLGLSTMTMSSRFNDPTWCRVHWWNQCKDRKNTKESRRTGAICPWSLYLIIGIRERFWQRSDRGNDGENECEYRRGNKQKKKQFSYLLRIPVKWKTSWEWTQVCQDEFQMSCSSTIIHRWNSQKSPTKFCLLMKCLLTLLTYLWNELYVRRLFFITLERN